MNFMEEEKKLENMNSCQLTIGDLLMHKFLKKN